MCDEHIADATFHVVDEEFAVFRQFPVYRKIKRKLCQDSVTQTNTHRDRLKQQTVTSMQYVGLASSLCSNHVGLDDFYG